MPRVIALLAPLLLAGLGQTISGVVRAEIEYQPFFDQSAVIRRVIILALDCAPPPPAPVELRQTSKYRQLEGETAEDALERYRRSMEAIDLFGNTTADLADRALATLYRQKLPARCAGSWLEAWARAGALTGDASRQGAHIRKWELAVYAIAYQKVQPWLDAGSTEPIEAWLRRLGRLVQATYPRDSDLQSGNNNHLNWAVWATANAAVATSDEALWEWSLERFRMILSTIPEDALLPLEMKRGAAALGYQIYATAPLVLLAELYRRNGIDTFHMHSEAIARLVDRALRALADPSEIEARAGEKQAVDDVATSSRLSWLEVYTARFPSARAEKLLMPLRPLGHRTYGGNISQMFGPLASHQNIPHKKTDWAE